MSRQRFDPRVNEPYGCCRSFVVSQWLEFHQHASYIFNSTAGSKSANGKTYAQLQWRRFNAPVAMDGAQATNPFRSPRWRYNRVLKILQSPDDRIRRFDDHPIRVCHRYLSLGATSDGDSSDFQIICEDYPHVVSAFSLHYSPSPESELILQARLLHFGVVCADCGSHGCG